ncbi:MAG: GyrI-like domain-containing protein [Candidatus Bathyarchaeota archaeon]|nr:GyrI-like domain-containing protein [Candidatus Bathyarchaeota archaeon]
MKKTDLKKELKQLYNPPEKEAVIVDVPKMNFLMVDGQGDPNTAQEYRDAIEALYAVSYTLKFMIKKGEEVDYVVMPLEGLWRAEDMTEFNMGNKDAWEWTSMIMQPPYVTQELVQKALKQVEERRNLPALSKMRFGSFHEGLSVQIMHIGPYSAEGPTIERLHNFIREKGYGLRGKHHEIYLSDPRRSKLGKLKTIIRQPIT